MSVPNIQNNKYTPVSLPEIVSPRSKLLERFSQSAKKKLLFVSAPGGSGKTVSALLWAKQTLNKPVWLGLDAYDDSISVFYRMFCMGLLSAQPNNTRMTDIIQNPSFSASPVEHTIILLSEFVWNNEEYVLVLDDFHVIADHEILKSLPFILRRLPHSFTTLILSRSEPDEYLTEYMQSLQAEVIGSDDLCLTADEIYALFLKRGKNVTPEDAQTAFAFTGGWAIAVSALTRSDAPASEYLDLNALTRYFHKNIWSKWDESVRAFLITTAAVDEIPVSLCELITGRADARELLEKLCKQNAYLTRTEDDVYRLHHLFLDSLRDLPEYESIDKKNIWCKAAAYYADKGDVIVASLYACKSGNIKTILDTLFKYMTVSNLPIHEIIYHLKESLFKVDFCKLCEECPVLYEPLVYMAFSTGDAPRFEAYMDKLKQNLAVILYEYPKFAEAAVTFMMLDYRTPLVEHFAKLSEFPPSVFEEPEIRRSTYSFRLPFLHRGNRDFYELTAPETAAEWIRSSKIVLKSHYKPIIHATLSGIKLEQNRLNEALTQAQTAYSELTDSTTEEIRFSVYMHLAAVYSAMDKQDELTATVEKTEQFINEKAEVLRPNFIAFTARLKLWNGEINAAREWLKHYFVNESESTEAYKIYLHFTTIRAYTLLGEFEKAKAIAERVKKISKHFRRPQDSSEAGVLLSVILWAQGHKEESQHLMEAALSELQPYSFNRLIADEGAAVLQVLRKICRKTACTDYCGTLDPVYVNNVYITAYTTSKQRGGIMANFEKTAVKLSKQQKMLLRFMAQGYKRQGIADKTGLSINTVKSYIKLIYEKLGVNSVTDAVVKARSLGIIE